MLGDEGEDLLPLLLVAGEDGVEVAVGNGHAVALGEVGLQVGLGGGSVELVLPDGQNNRIVAGVCVSIGCLNDRLAWAGNLKAACQLALLVI